MTATGTDIQERHVLADMSGAVLPEPITWDSDDDAGVARAWAAFNLLKALRCLTYAEGPSGPEIIREFDPSAKRIVAVRQLQGG